MSSGRCAIPIVANIDVKMAAVGGVDIGRQDDSEISAGVESDGVEKSPFGATIVPITGD